MGAHVLAQDRNACRELGPYRQCGRPAEGDAKDEKERPASDPRAKSLHELILEQGRQDSVIAERPSNQRDSSTAPLSAESLAQVGDEVFRMLETDRKAEQALRGARAGALDRGAMLDEAFRAAETRGAGEETKASGDRERLRLTSRHDEGEHSTGLRHLSRSNLVAGVASKAGVVDSLYPRMLGQEGRYRSGIAAMRPHAPGKRANAPQHQPGVEG